MGSAARISGLVPAPARSEALGGPWPFDLVDLSGTKDRYGRFSTVFPWTSCKNNTNRANT